MFVDLLANNHKQSRKLGKIFHSVKLIKTENFRSITVTKDVLAILAPFIVFSKKNQENNFQHNDSQHEN